MNGLSRWGGTLLAASVLIGCGGSSGDALAPVTAQEPAGSSEGQVSNNLNPDNGSTEGNSTVEEVNGNASVDSGNSPVNSSSTSNDNTNGSGSNNGEAGNSTSVDNSTTPDQTYVNSICVPGASAVSYEIHNGGVHVPFPSSGFGWDGNQMCEELLVPYVKTRPGPSVGEGFVFSAASAGTYDHETRNNDINNLLLSPVPGYIDGTGVSEWLTMHDGTNLYLYIHVATDQFNGLFQDSEELWHDDSVEIFIDGDNSKGSAYDGVNDFQVSLSLEEDNPQPVISQQSAAGLGISYKVFFREPRSSSFAAWHIVEVTINLESAGIEIGKPFGFDVHINDDDNGGDRDAKWGWFEKSGFDRSWYQPSALGTLLLTDCADRNACGSYQVLSP